MVMFLFDALLDADCVVDEPPDDEPFDDDPQAASASAAKAARADAATVRRGMRLLFETPR
jgi:hypothetical protein